MHQVVGGGHVLPKLLLQAEEAERRRSVGVALRQTAGCAAGGRQGGGAQGRVCETGKKKEDFSMFGHTLTCVHPVNCVLEFKYRLSKNIYDYRIKQEKYCTHYAAIIFT